MNVKHIEVVNISRLQNKGTKIMVLPSTSSDVINVALLKGRSTARK